MMPPRGISGRINGSNSADPSMWPGPPPQQPPGPGPHHHVAPTGPPPGPPSQASKMVPPGPAAGNVQLVSNLFHCDKRKSTPSIGCWVLLFWLELFFETNSQVETLKCLIGKIWV